MTNVRAPFIMIVVIVVTVRIGMPELKKAQRAAGDRQFNDA